ncbi:MULTISPECIES: LysR substrate-binding domain-containing protein [Burkholderia]|uniref:LysR substrate-binding domain-containing protein n=1 Tax=Burkholderia TaxID=32008 RepID=UPI001588A3B6|nr:MULTISPECIES: LysR substrate-binding domain-containing protein [Burkholderia]MBY4870667.1 LysR family transcriptional regulator [Burkholderia anthina]
MDFKQLQYFARIAELGNMTRAAETLHVAQPALSQQIANLEGELDARLFDRGVYGVRTTPAGETLYRYAKSLLKQLEDARQAISSEVDQPSGHVVIGIPGSAGKLVVTPLVKELTSRSAIVTEIIERPSAELVDLVIGSKLDVALGVDVPRRRGLAIRPVLREELFAIAPPSEARTDARTKKSITAKELAAQPLFLPGFPNTIRQRVEAAFLEEHLEYRILSQVSSLDMVVRLVSSGLGWGVLPWSAVADEVQRGRIRALRVSDRSLSRELSVCISDSVPLSRAAEVVRDCMLDIIQALIRSKRWEHARLVSHD